MMWRLVTNMMYSNLDLLDYDGTKISPIHKKLISSIVTNGNTDLDVYQSHYITDSDTPLSISHKYYKSTEYWWVVLFVNNFRHYYDWPATTDVIQAELGANVDVIAKWYDTETGLDADNNNTWLLKEGSILAGERFVPITLLQQAYELNDAKRPIKVLKYSALHQFIHLLETEK